MRDRLVQLNQVQTDSEGLTTVELDPLSDQAHPDQELDAVLQETQQIRLDIQQIQNDISELKEVQYQTLNKTTFDDAERDSNAIGADIKRRGEAVLTRLHMLNGVREDLESERGVTHPTTRIARTQYQYLSSAFQEVMTRYNEAELGHRDACRRQIQRQLEVVGQDVTEQELEEMMESGDWNVFSVQVQGVTVRSALMQIESRHKELLDLEKRVREIQEVFLDVAVLTQEQGLVVQNIQKHVQSTQVTVEEGVGKLDRALAADKNNPFKKLFCGCFPCYYN